MAAGMGDKCRVWVARKDGQPASALITVEDGVSIQGVKAAMDKDLAGPLHTKRRFAAEGHHYHSYAIERWPITESDEKLRVAAKRILRFKDF